jgi:hypothetical protein
MRAVVWAVWASELRRRTWYREGGSEFLWRPLRVCDEWRGRLATPAGSSPEAIRLAPDALTGRRQGLITKR